ncbi:putative receptor protein kinase ZmPK1 [Tanacetum coccineum]
MKQTARIFDAIENKNFRLRKKSQLLSKKKIIGFPTHRSCASPLHNSFDTHDLIRVVRTYHQDEDDHDAQHEAIQDDNPTITGLIHVEYSLDDNSKTETPMVIEEDEKLMVKITTKLHKVPTEDKSIMPKESSIKPYAYPVGIKCYQCQEVGHTSNQYRATKRVNLAEGDKAHSESKDEGLIISPNAVFEDDDDHSEAFLDVFNVIVDGGSSENIISWDIVTRLKLTPKKHLKPYKISWIKVVREVRVTEQCEVLFAMGKYKDTVLFDIVDMDCHVLLGRPWQSDLNVVYKGKENTYTFSKADRKFTLCPYSGEVQVTTTKEKKNQIMLCSTRNKEKNICATTIPSDKVLNPVMNLWSSSFQERDNDGGPKLKKRNKR